MSDLAVRRIVDVLLGNWIEDSGQRLAVARRGLFPGAHRAQLLHPNGSAVAITRNGCRGALHDMRAIGESLFHLRDRLRLVWFILYHRSSILQTGHTRCRHDRDLSLSKYGIE